MNKKLGYGFLGLGVIVLLANIGALQETLKISTLMAKIRSLYVTIAGIVLLALGIVVIGFKEKTKQAEEVPIYKGKEIVGYRRHK